MPSGRAARAQVPAPDTAELLEKLDHMSASLDRETSKARRLEAQRAEAQQQLEECRTGLESPAHVSA